MENLDALLLECNHHISHRKLAKPEQNSEQGKKKEGQCSSNCSCYACETNKNKVSQFIFFLKDNLSSRVAPGFLYWGGGGTHDKQQVPSWGQRGRELICCVLIMFALKGQRGGHAKGGAPVPPQWCCPCLSYQSLSSF